MDTNEHQSVRRFLPQMTRITQTGTDWELVGGGVGEGCLGLLGGWWWQCFGRHPEGINVPVEPGGDRLRVIYDVRERSVDDLDGLRCRARVVPDDGTDAEDVEDR